ncbi:MAG: hypothetical protein ACR2IF_18840 [Terriglobales bacterium]
MKLAATALIVGLCGAGLLPAYPGQRPGHSFFQQSRPAATATQAMYNAAAGSAETKIRHVEENAKRNPPDRTPTVFTEREINAYVQSGRVQLPTGVRAVRFTGTPAVIDTVARIDFDAITASRRSSNPLLPLFSGVHDVHAVAHATGKGGQANVHIDSAEMDGVSIPRIALDYFIEHYVTPKYPNVGMDSTFQLPDKIDSAVVGAHQLTVVQK